MKMKHFIEKYDGKYIELGLSIKLCGIISTKPNTGSIIIKMSKESSLRFTRESFIRLVNTNGGCYGYKGIKIIDTMGDIDIIYSKYNNIEILLLTTCGIKYKAIILVDQIENIIHINRYGGDGLKLTVDEFNLFINTNGCGFGYSGIDFNVQAPIVNEILEKKIVVYDDNTIKSSGKHSGLKLSEIPATYLISITGMDKRHRLYDQNLVDYIKNNLTDIKNRVLIEQESNIKRQKSIIFNEPKFKIRPSGKQVRLACPIANKYVYITEREAKDEIKRIAQSYGSKKKPHRCYECEHCNGWHLTSKLSNVELKFSENN